MSEPWSHQREPPITPDGEACGEKGLDTKRQNGCGNLANMDMEGMERGH